jgi:hypothetical protein
LVLVEASRSLLVVEGGDDVVGVLFRVVKSQAADARSTTS